MHQGMVWAQYILNSSWQYNTVAAAYHKLFYFLLWVVLVLRMRTAMHWNCNYTLGIPQGHSIPCGRSQDKGSILHVDQGWHQGAARLLCDPENTTSSSNQTKKNPSCGYPGLVNPELYSGIHYIHSVGLELCFRILPYNSSNMIYYIYIGWKYPKVH